MCTTRKQLTIYHCTFKKKQFNIILFIYLIEDGSLTEPDILEYMIENSTAILECPFKVVNDISWITTSKNNEYVKLAISQKINKDIENIKVVGNHAIGEYNLELQRVTKDDEKVYQCISNILGNPKEYAISVRLSSKYDLYFMTESFKLIQKLVP